MEGDAGKLFRYDMAKQCNRPEEEVPSDSDLELTFSRLLLSFENMPTLYMYSSTRVSNNNIKGSHSTLKRSESRLPPERW